MLSKDRRTAFGWEGAMSFISNGTAHAGRSRRSFYTADLAEG